jgi:hypothetical protein
MFVAPMDPPSPSFIVLRAALLAIDDLCRQRVREWLVNAIDFRGTVSDTPVPADPLVRLFAAAVGATDEIERRAYRQWVVRWTDHTGRIISPGERSARLEEIRKSASERGR